MFRLSPGIVAILCLLLPVLTNLAEVSHHDLLGVSKKASQQEIRQAYKKLAIKLHPDKNPDKAVQERFLKITEAYETLKDPERRRQYETDINHKDLYQNGLYYDDPHVITITENHFDSYMVDGIHFINFYSPFCPPCQRLSEDWKKLAKVYKGIIKVGAVNCLFYNYFCRKMGINAYPTLRFYPNGKSDDFTHYKEQRSFNDLDKYVIRFLRERAKVDTISLLRGRDQPALYVIDKTKIFGRALTRLAYQLKGATPVYVIQEGLKSQLTDNDDVTVVFQYGDVRREMTSVDEVELIQEIVDAFPKIELIDPDRLKDIRNSLRRGQDGPWIIYFSSEESDQMKPYKVKSLLTEKEFAKNAYKNVNVGEIKCNIWPQLCLSLQIDAAPGWGALKRGGAYQRAAPGQNIASFVKTAVPALNLHTLSLSEFQRVLDGDVGTWALAVIPHKVSWDQILEPFSRASLRFVHSSSIQFGIMSCSAANDRHCRLLAENDALIVVQNGTSRRAYGGALDEAGIVGFIDLLKDGVVTEVVTDEQLYQVFDAASRSHSWLLAFLPSHCGRACSQHYYQWQLVAQKLQPLSSVRVALVDCAQASLGICANVASPSLRLYPSRSDRNYVANLQKLGTAPYIWSWALKLIDEVHPLSWHVFSRTVIAEELDPSRVKKPWLVYFHSPRCSHCYEKYADFAIAAIKLNNRLNVGRVNCLEEMGVCNHEEITHYPALKLYLGRSRERAFSRVIPVPLDNYKIIYAKVVPFLAEYPVHAAGARATSHDEL